MHSHSSLLIPIILLNLLIPITLIILSTPSIPSSGIPAGKERCQRSGVVVGSEQIAVTVAHRE
jgi:hypothetical protein